MLFNWQIKDTCVVFDWWHISSPTSMLFSCLAIFLIAAGYEWMRVYSIQLEEAWKEAETRLQRNSDDTEELLGEQRFLVHAYEHNNKLSKHKRMIQSSIYALLVAISFWLMLVFMTYNGYLMIATVLGAGAGHFMFSQGRLRADRSIQCH
ncbi:Ctr copper transporter [Blakeslea trispora]|nr:Ctr copper transporter [Blakeslea trispora]